MKCFTADDFDVRGVVDVDPLEEVKKGKLYDTRTGIISNGCDLTKRDWFYNYLRANQTFAFQNPQSRPNYLLKMGYIPLVYVPSCFSELTINMTAILDKYNIPYVKLSPSSFVKSYIQLDNDYDTWGSKMDIWETFNLKSRGMQPTDVTTNFVWEVLVNGQ